jgi:DNA-binding NarL/FixJ family response regulator
MSGSTVGTQAAMCVHAAEPTPIRAPIRVLVVDDAPIFRHGVAEILTTAGCRVVGTATGAGDALLMVAAQNPAVVVATAQLAGVTGVLLAAIVRQRHPAVRVVLLGELTSARLLAAAHAGAAAVVPPSADAADLCAVVTQVARGETPIIEAFVTRRDVARTVLRLLYAPADVTPGAADGAPTASELLALDCLARGLSDREASQRVYLEPRTLRNHLQRLCARHDLHSRTQLLRFAAAQGWIAPCPPVVATAA